MQVYVTIVDNAEDLDIVMRMYNLLEYRDNYAKTLASYGNIVEMNQVIIIQQILNYLNLNQVLQIILIMMVLQT